MQEKAKQKGRDGRKMMGNDKNEAIRKGRNNKKHKKEN
jgi:hypothetical protein